MIGIGDVVGSGLKLVSSGSTSMGCGVRESMLPSMTGPADALDLPKPGPTVER
jgi:hypothetical protein